MRAQVAPCSPVLLANVQFVPSHSRAIGKSWAKFQDRSSTKILQNRRAAFVAYKIENLRLRVAEWVLSFCPKSQPRPLATRLSVNKTRVLFSKFPRLSQNISPAGNIEEENKLLKKKKLLYLNNRTVFLLFLQETCSSLQRLQVLVSVFSLQRLQK